MATDRKIVIAVDETEVSAYAFTWALHNLLKKTDKVVVLTATPFVSLDFPSADIASEYGTTAIPSQQDTEEQEKVVVSHGKELIAKFCKQCAQAEIACAGEVVKGDAGTWIVDEGNRLSADVIVVGCAVQIACAGEVVKGDAGTWIVDEGNRLSADVIVVGSRGGGVLKRMIMGSKSDYVLHNAACPVAIIRHEEEALQVHDPLSSSGGSRKIVIAVDDSREAVYAFKWALAHFVREGDNVIIYHVHQSVSAPVSAMGTGNFGIEEVYVPNEIMGQTQVESLNESEKMVEKFMSYVTKESKVKCEGMVVTGQAETKVIEGLTNLHADAVIIGTHDRNTLSRSILSSLTDYLAHNSPCPLIVVKLPKEPTAAEVEAAKHAHDT